MHFCNRLFITVLLSVCMFGFALPTTARAQQSKNIPALQFKNTDEETITTKHITAKKGVLIIYFRSDCDHCIHTLQQLKTTAKQYPVDIWLVSAETTTALRAVEDMFGFYDIDNVKVLRDYSSKMHTWYNFTKLPFIVLYNTQKQQVQIWEDLPTAGTIRKSLVKK
jgi:peroxiredoxin